MKRLLCTVAVAALSAPACVAAAAAESAAAESTAASAPPPGAQIIEGNPKERRYGIGMAPPQGGEESVAVIMVPAGSVAAEAGLRVGDRILSVNGTPVPEIEIAGFMAAMRASPLSLVVDRADETLTFDLSLDGAPPRVTSGGERPTPTSADGDEDFSDAALELADLLAARYLFPDVGARYAEMLRANARDGAYAGMANAAAFSARVNQQLAEVSVDRHLHVTPPGAESPGRRMMTSGSGAGSTPDAVPDSGWLADGVAFMEIGLMPPGPELKEWAATFMEEHADAKALVLDLRFCRGGTIDMMNGFLPYLYGEETHLLNMDMRPGADDETVAEFDATPELVRGDAGEDMLSWRHVISPSQTANKPDMAVYVLTGHTGSACEHLTLALKATDRATVVGGVTAGAGHFAAYADFGDGFSMLLPIGRTYDPETGQGWEGDGIAPDVATDPDDAAAEALRLIADVPT